MMMTYTRYTSPTVGCEPPLPQSVEYNDIAYNEGYERGYEAGYADGLGGVKKIAQPAESWHTATIATPNPPLTADEWLVWAQAGEAAWLAYPANKYLKASRYNWEPTTLSLASVISAIGCGFVVYAHDPAVVPPTERDE